MINQLAPMIEFLPTDRCDRCIQRAVTLAQRDGLELMFCAHHRKRHYEALLDDGWQVTDDYERLEELESVPA